MPPLTYRNTATLTVHTESSNILLHFLTLLYSQILRACGCKACSLRCESRSCASNLEFSIVNKKISAFPVKLVLNSWRAAKVNSFVSPIVFVRMG